MKLQLDRLLGVALITISLPGAAQAVADKPRVPVLVELFTSEGCSSCPPADALLARLVEQQPVNGAQIIVLGEHVDYWDGLGWHDRFSSPQYTKRQRDYGWRFLLDSVYTPQMVVDGAAQFVGNNQEQALRAVTEATRKQKPPLSLSTPTMDGLVVSASISAPFPAWAKVAQGDVYAALVDPQDTTDVGKGENGGRRLRHVAVVRTLMRVGSLRDLAPGPLAFTLNAPAGTDPAAMRVVVFAQQEGAGRVLGVVMSAPAAVHATLEQNLLVGRPAMPHLE